VFSFMFGSRFVFVVRGSWFIVQGSAHADALGE
jgi:hypothetical protein